MTNKITKKNTSISTQVTSLPTGMEDFDTEDLIVPRLNLLQDLSKTVKAKTAEAGNFQNNLTEEVYPNPLDLIFISAKKTAVYLVIGEGLKCRSNDRITSM